MTMTNCVLAGRSGILALWFVVQDWIVCSSLWLVHQHVDRVSITVMQALTLLCYLGIYLFDMSFRVRKVLYTCHGSNTSHKVRSSIGVHMNAVGVYSMLCIF